MIDDEWTVVGKKGRPKAQRRPDNSVAQPTTPTRSGVNGKQSAPRRQNSLKSAMTQHLKPALQPQEQEVSKAADIRESTSDGQIASETSTSLKQDRQPQVSASIGWGGRERKLRWERTPEERARDLVSHINLAKEDIINSDFWRELQRRMQQAEEDAVEATPAGRACATWDAITKVVLLGLGSLAASPAPRYQLGLALLLAEGFPKLAGQVELRDPVFTELDKQILKDCNCKVLETDEEAFRAAEQATLFYLPHCAASISHNLLAANWTEETLPQVAMIGNSFETIAQNWREMPVSQREGRPEPEGILKLVAGRSVVDVPVKECNFPVRGAFNDTSVMLFPALGVEGEALTAVDLSHLQC